ncbi:DUF5136 domain-containing protein [Streptomyces sp. B21-088]
MTQLHAPKTSRNQETGRLSFMESVSPQRRGRIAGVGCPSGTHGGSGHPGPRAPQLPVRFRPCLL